MAAMKRVLSGIQPTGVPHIGNYLGALVNWSALQGPVVPPSATTTDAAGGNAAGRSQVLYSIVDLHSMTVPFNPAELRVNVREMAASLLACGVDPDRSSLFVQSQVKEHAELAWLLGCMTPLGWLRRMTQFKDKGKNQDKAALGLLSYPVLMAADILIYKATTVPVGDDQSQHLELARSIASSFNHTYGQVFPVPEGIFPDGKETRVMSLRNARKKMSKSEVSDMSRINLTDGADLIADKIRKAKSDAIVGITFDPEERPEVANLLTMMSVFEGRSVQELCEECQDMSMKQFKERLAEAVVAHVTPIGAEVSRLLADPQYLDNVLAQGQAAAQSIARETMREVKGVMGLVPSVDG